MLALVANAYLSARRRIVSDSFSSCVRADVTQLAKPEVKIVREAPTPAKIELAASSTRKQLLSQTSFRAVELCNSSGLRADGEVIQTLKQHCPELIELCKEDVLRSFEVFHTYTDSECLEVKLETLHHTPCTQFHMDRVPLRALCTYLGEGTVYLPSRACAVLNDEVKAVLEDEAESVAAGELVFLKGSAWGDGPGAVHRSPDMTDGDVRLLLTVDVHC